MKVLMFGWEFPPHISGGLGTACKGLTKALAGFPELEVTFVVPKVWGDEDQPAVCLLDAGKVKVLHRQLKFDDVASKIEYYELQSDLIPYLGTNEFYELSAHIYEGSERLAEITDEGTFLFSGEYGKDLFQEIKNYALVAETLARELDFDVIHAHDWMTFPAGMAAKAVSGKPLVVHLHSTEFDRCPVHPNPTILALEKEGMLTADAVIAVSNLTRDILIGNYQIDSSRITTVYNAVEKIDYPKRILKSGKSASKTVTFMGRITMQKGPGFFIEAANLVLQRFPEVKFVMGGKGDLRDLMISRASELGISGRISFPGFIPDQEIPNFFRQSDVFVMPSVSEPFGIVALEAVQTGVPVILSKQSGVSEVIQHAQKVDYWDVEALADAICLLLNDKILVRKNTGKARQEIGQLSWKRSAEKLAGIYKSLHKETESL